MTRIFTYDFESYCNLKPLEPLPARASEIARDYNVLHDAGQRAGGTVSTNAAFVSIVVTFVAGFVLCFRVRR